MFSARKNTNYRTKEIERVLQQCVKCYVHSPWHASEIEYLP